MSLVLEVLHETLYEYSASVSLAHHLAHLQPRQDDYQQLLDFDLQIEPAPAAQPRLSFDAMGNAEHRFSLAQAHHSLNVSASSRLAISPRFAELQVDASPAWDTLPQRLRYVARSPYEPAVQFAMPSPYVPRLAVLRDYGAVSFRPGRPVAAAAIDLMQRVHADYRYQSQSTDIDTPLIEVWANKRGVCQDFAHLMAGAIRMQGLPARYVSGYLLTHAPDGGARMQGADASHAWVQVWCPDTPGVPTQGPDAGWLDLDPTNDVVPAAGHVRVAVGRDFGDVTPLRGVIRGGGRHSLHVGVTTRVISPAAQVLDPGTRVASVSS